MAGSKIADKHKATPYLITDFETGGFDMKKEAITEIGMLAVKGDTLEEIGRYSALIKPYGKEYADEAVAKTGLSPAFLEKNGKPIDVVLLEATEFIVSTNIYNSKTNFKPIIVGHNPAFEVRCFQALAEEAKRLKLPGMMELKKLFHGDEDYYGNYQPAVIDTISLAKMLFAANKRIFDYKLTTVAERMSVNIPDAHRAMSDVIPTWEILKQIITGLREGGGNNTQSNQTVSNFRDNFHFKY